LVSLYGTTIQICVEEFGLKRVDFDINDNTLDFVIDTER
jgi:hypothetical protein